MKLIDIALYVDRTRKTTIEREQKSTVREQTTTEQEQPTRD